MAMKGVLRPGHFQMRVLDLEESVKFYRDVMGLVEQGRDKQGRVYIQDSEVALEDLVARLNAITGANAETRIYVRGDKDIQYGLVMQVMGLINQAGYSKVALLAEMPPVTPATTPPAGSGSGN